MQEGVSQRGCHPLSYLFVFTDTEDKLTIYVVAKFRQNSFEKLWETCAEMCRFQFSLKYVPISVSF